MPMPYSILFEVVFSHALSTDCSMSARVVVYGQKTGVWRQVYDIGFLHDLVIVLGVWYFKAHAIYVHFED